LLYSSLHDKTRAEFSGFGLSLVLPPPRVAGFV
jgi:hypothetical protein